MFLGEDAIGSSTEGMKPHADGSMTILLQKGKPADTANWLPAPQATQSDISALRPETPILMAPTGGPVERVE
jgi:hypothetical protein